MKSNMSCVPANGKVCDRRSCQEKCRHVPRLLKIFALFHCCYDRTCVSHLREYSIGETIEKQVVAFAVLSEILACVVDDTIRPERAYQLTFFVLQTPVT